MKKCNQEGSSQTRHWSVEEAEVAAQDRFIWKLLTSQAAEVRSVKISKLHLNDKQICHKREKIAFLSKTNSLKWVFKPSNFMVKLIHGIFRICDSERLSFTRFHANLRELAHWTIVILFLVCFAVMLESLLKDLSEAFSKSKFCIRFDFANLYSQLKFSARGYYASSKLALTCIPRKLPLPLFPKTTPNTFYCPFSEVSVLVPKIIQHQLENV